MICSPRLSSTYRVHRESFLDHVRPDGPEPAERLVPAVLGAWSLALTYTEAPGLVVRCGHDQRGHIPICACDACDETFESCVEQLIRFVDPVITGRFGESLTLADGVWHHHNWSVSATDSSTGSVVVDDDRAEQLLARMPGGECTWRPWVRPYPGTP